MENCEVTQKDIEKIYEKLENTRISNADSLRSILLGIVGIVGSVVYSLISDHIAIQNTHKDVLQIRDNMEHGRSRLYPEFITLRGRVDTLQKLSSRNEKWTIDWEKHGVLPLDMKQNFRLDNLESRFKKDKR